MIRYKLKPILRTILTICLILIILPISEVHQSVFTETLEQSSTPVSEGISSTTSVQDSQATAPIYPEDFDLMQYLSDNPNEYQKVWEPWLTKAAVHAIATSDDGDFLAVGGGYLYDNEAHIYRWNLETREYDKVWDSGDGIIKGDVLSLDFGDTDNNKFMDIAVGSADGHVYVFEQRHIYDPLTRTENQFEHVWTSPKLRPVFSVLIEDTDKDGVLDIWAGSWDDKIHAYEYRKHSGYPFSKEHWIEYEEVWNSSDLIADKVTALATGDTNHNGLPEIVAGTRNGKIYIFENDGATLYIEGVPFPLTNDNKYVLNCTIAGNIWNPILSLDTGDLDGDSDDEISAVAAGQGVYLIDYSKAYGYRLNKLTRPLESWEKGVGADYPLDHYVDDLVSAVGVNYGQMQEPLTQPPLEISPDGTAMARTPDGKHSVFTPFLTFVNDSDKGPWPQGFSSFTFPDNTADWLWTHGLADVQSHVGEFWVFREFNVPSSTNLTISLTVDNYYTLYVDDLLVGSDADWRTVESYDISVSAGTHTLKMKVGNAGDKDNPAGLILSVKNATSGKIFFNSQDDYTWKITSTGILDFGKDEEATGNGNSFHDLTLNFSSDGFVSTPNFDELRFSVSQDNSTFAAIRNEDLRFEVWGGRLYVYIDLDSVLAEKRWDYVRYLNISYYSNYVYRGEGFIPFLFYALDSVKAETLFRPLSTATTAVIRTLNLDSQSSVYEFNDRVQAYSTGFTYEEIAKQNKRTKELAKVVIGTADGRLIAFGYNKSSTLYDQIWDSYTDDWFSLKTNIWAIQDVKTLGKMPTWMLNETRLDVPFSFTVDFPSTSYASMAFADVNRDGSSDLIVGTKLGGLTCPINQELKQQYFTEVNKYYSAGMTGDINVVSAAFGQLNTSGIIKLPNPPLPSPIKPSTTSLIESSYEPSAITYYRFLDNFELIVGYEKLRDGSASEFRLDYWDGSTAYYRVKPLTEMETTGHLSQIIDESAAVPKVTLEDMDGDNDLDITLTNGRIYYLENVGTKSAPSFTLRLDYYSSINLDNPDRVFSGPRLVNFDIDGDYDLVVGFGDKAGATYYENTGTAANPIWVEERRLFYNFKHGLRSDNFTDPNFCDVRDLYDVLNAMGVQQLPEREVFVDAYMDTFGTRFFMSAYDNTKNRIVSFVGDIASHTRFLVGINPRIVRLEVALANYPLTNYGFHVFETWNNDADLDAWTMTVSSGDVDGDGKNEVIVGDFDNNIYVFEHLTNNTYKRAFRSFDIYHNESSDVSPYAWQELEGLSGTFYRKIFDHVENLIADTDLDNDREKEIIAAADLSVYVFESTGVDDQYKLIWREDLRNSPWSEYLKAGNIEKISALSWHKDLDKNGYGEIIICAGEFVFIYESGPGDTFREGHGATNDVIGYWNFDEASGVMAHDSSGNGNIGTLSTGPSWVDGKYGTALSFDGVDDYVEITENTDLDPHKKDWTISAWVNIGRLTAGIYTQPSNYGCVIMNKRQSEYDSSLTLLVHNGTSEMSPNARFAFILDGHSQAAGAESTIMNVFGWHHVIGVRRGGELYVYVDGVKYGPNNYLLAGSHINSTTDVNSNTPIHLAHHGAWERYYTGIIDEVKIYNRALTDGEIATVMGCLSFPGFNIQAIATEDTDSDGYNEIVIGGASGQDGFVTVLEHQAGAYINIWSDVSSKWMKGSRVNTIVIDDQDYDGRKELIVGHDYGITIWEHTGADNQYAVRETMTSSPVYPKPTAYKSVEWLGSRDHAFILNRTSDIFQLSNGTLIQIYAKYAEYNVTDPITSAKVPAIRLFVKSSNNNGTTWASERRLTSDTEYGTSVILWELEPSVTEVAGTIWVAWRTESILNYVRNYDIYARNFVTGTGWKSVEKIISVSKSGGGVLSPSIWRFNNTHVAVFYRWPRASVGDIHYRLRGPSGTWEYMGTLPYIGFDQKFPFEPTLTDEATSMDAIRLSDGGVALVFAGRYKNESKGDYDIWVMTANSTMHWNFPTRVTIKPSREYDPSITQLNSKTETLVVMFGSASSYDTATMISYSKDLGRSWSEPETTMRLETLDKGVSSASVTASKNEGFFYSFKLVGYGPAETQHRIFVGFNPSSDWTKYEIGNVHTLVVGDTDGDMLRDIIANYKNRATVFEIKHTGTTYQEHQQVWTSEELAEDVTDIAIGDGNGNGWPEIIIAAKRGNVYSYEITDTTLPKTSFIAAEVKSEFQVSSQPVTSIKTGNFDGDTKPDIVTGGKDTNVIAWKADGTIIWNFSAPAGRILDLAVVDLNKDGVDDVVAGIASSLDETGAVYAINGVTGSQLWKFENPTGEGVSHVRIGDLDGDETKDVAACASKKKIYALDGTEGSMLWSITASDVVVGLEVGNLRGSGHMEVVAVTGDGTVYALGENGTQLWTFQDLKGWGSKP